MNKYRVTYLSTGTAVETVTIEAESYKVIAHSERMPGLVTFTVSDDPIHAIAADKVISIEKLTDSTVDSL